MTFDYLMRVTVDASLDIEDIGNCAVQAYDDKGQEFILIIRTVLGVTEVVQFGPVLPDIVALPSEVSYTYKRYTFQESKIIKDIKSFLNGQRSPITQAFTVDFDIAEKDIRNIVDFMSCKRE